MGWEIFKNTGRSLKPKVSIRGNSQIGFNIAAIREFSMENYKYAILLYDKENKKIGIKLTNNKAEEGVCKLRVKPQAGASVPAKAYIEYYNLNNSKIRRFDASLDSKENIIVANLP